MSQSRSAVLSDTVNTLPSYGAKGGTTERQVVAGALPGGASPLSKAAEFGYGPVVSGVVAGQTDGAEEGARLIRKAKEVDQRLAAAHLVAKASPLGGPERRTYKEIQGQSEQAWQKVLTYVSDLKGLTDDLSGPLVTEGTSE